MILPLDGGCKVSRQSHWFGKTSCLIVGRIPGGRWGKYKRNIPSPEEMLEWFGNADRPSNLGVVTGRGLVVLDFDNLDWYNASRDFLKLDLDSYTVTTSRGKHVYIWVAEEVSNQNTGWLEIKSGLYVVAPPSIHPSGHVYQADDRPIKRVEKLTDIIPAHLLESQPARKKTTPIIGKDLPKVSDLWGEINNPGRTLSRDIKARFKILDMVGPTTQRGRMNWARCPLHDDHNPSLEIDPATGSAICWGGCNHSKWMDVIRFYGLKRKISDTEAMHELRRQL